MTNSKMAGRARMSFRCACFVILCAGAAFAQKTLSKSNERIYQLAKTDLNAFAKEVSKGQGSELGETRAIVGWLVANFEWETTDYQKRTLQQIIERRGGNCNDLATVAMAAMAKLDIKIRKVHEVHIRTEDKARGERAHELAKEKGSNAYSVFGRHHNDHVYLEIYDSTVKDWFPADPWSGLVRHEEWLKGRVWFGKRSSLAPDGKEMIVPIGIFAADGTGNFTIDRTKHYLADEFDRLYKGKLHRLPEWKDWSTGLDLLKDKVGGTFAGTVNLHDYESDIDNLATMYEKMAKKFRDGQSR